MASLFQSFFVCCIRQKQNPSIYANGYVFDEDDLLIHPVDEAEPDPDEEAQRRWDELADIVRVYENKMVNVMAKRPFTTPGERPPPVLRRTKRKRPATTNYGAASSTQRTQPHLGPHPYPAPVFAYQRPVPVPASVEESEYEDDSDEEEAGPLLDIRIVDYDEIDAEGSDEEYSKFKPIYRDRNGVVLPFEVVEREERARGRAPTRRAGAPSSS